MIKVGLAALAAFAIAPAVLAAPAPAAPQDNPLAKNAVVLDLRNVDLATVAGQRVLAIRMDQAARAVCGDRLATIHLSLDSQSRSCQKYVVADIRSRIEARQADARQASAPQQLALR